MAHDVIMPQMGESVAEGTITTWLKSVGDKVERDEPLFEISTDKVDAEVPSPVAGTLKEIKAEAGETVAVDEIVAIIDDSGDSEGKAEDSKTEDKSQEGSKPEKSDEGDTKQAQKSEKSEAKQKESQQAESEEASEEEGDADGGETHEVTMPQMGESVAEGTITTWLKKEGDSVEKDEALFEISTDKVDAEIPSPVSGTLQEIKAQEGDTVEVGAVVALMGSGPAGSKKQTQQKKQESSQQQKAQESSSSNKQEESRETQEQRVPQQRSSSAQPSSVEERRRVKSSPVVRKIASQHDIDITQVPGTGISGRVTKKDIVSFIEGGGKTSQPSQQQQAKTQDRAPTRMPSSEEIFGSSVVPDAYRPRVFEGDRLEKLSTMRSKISEHMVVSRRISAHVQTVWEFDFTRVDQLRKQHKNAWQEKHGVKLTFTHFIAKATVDALKAFPIVNASLDGEMAIYHQSVNLGLAVALDWGLIVPVIHGADELNLLGIARRTNDLAERARNKKLKPDEVAGGTFTITNPGVFGNTFGIPIINQPQVAILSCGGIEKRPVVIDDMIGIRTRAYMCLSFDHRLIDGAVGDQFMLKLKAGIEEFDDSEL